MKPVLRASEMAQSILCNGSIRLREMVRRRPRDDGFEGSMMHWLVAARLIEEFGATPPPGGLDAPSVPVGYTVPPREMWVPNWLYRNVTEDYGPDWTCEVEAPLAYEFDRFILSGHIDVHGLSPDGLLIKGKDYKTGRIPVDMAECNWQVLAYLVLLRRAYPQAQAAEFEILQPRLSEEGGYKRITRVRVEGERWDNAVRSLEEYVNDALDNPNELTAGPDQCAWCVGLVCPKLQELLMELRMTLTPENMARIRRELDDQALADIVLAAKILDRHIEEAKDLAKERIGQAKSITASTGTVITAHTSNGGYKVKDPVAVMEELRKLVPDSILAKSLNYPVNRLKDAIAEGMNIPLGGKGQINAQNIWDARFAHLFEQQKKTELICG